MDKLYSQAFVLMEILFFRMNKIDIKFRLQH